MARTRPRYQTVLVAIGFSVVLASTGVAFAPSARANATPWIAGASTFTDDAMDSTGLFIAGVALMGLAGAVRRLSAPRQDLLEQTAMGQRAAGER